MKPACQFNRGHGIHDKPNALPQAVESKCEDSDESKDEDEDVEFDWEESDGNDDVEDEASIRSYEEPQLASEAIFLVGRRSRSIINDR